MTDAETKMWRQLRAKKLEGLKFRRQQPIGPYIVDFVSFEKRLVIEIDGSQHAQGKQLLIDTERDLWLNQQGYAILRFWNREILTNIDGITQRILECCQTKSAS